ncbi:hypothetical protein Q6670_004111 [Salmonella enterica]|nr:hypothetical protein [Salmonella enterica]
MKKLIIALTLAATALASASAMATEAKSCFSQHGKNVVIADAGKAFFVYDPELIGMNVYSPLAESGILDANGVGPNGSKVGTSYRVGFAGQQYVFRGCTKLNIKLPDVQFEEEKEEEDPNHELFKHNIDNMAKLVSEYGEELPPMIPVEKWEAGTKGKPSTYICDAVTVAPVDYENYQPVAFEPKGLKVVDDGTEMTVTLKRYADDKPSTLTVPIISEDLPAAQYNKEGKRVDIILAPSALSAFYAGFNCIKQK